MQKKKREEKAEHGLKDLMLCDIEGNMSATSFALSQLTWQLLLLDLVLLLYKMKMLGMGEKS